MQKNTVLDLPEQQKKPDETAGIPSIPLPSHEDQELHKGNESSSSKLLPSIEFLPYVDEVEEKRKFWKTVLITVFIFTLASASIIGYVLTQRLSQPSKPKINVQYVDTIPQTTIAINIQTTLFPTKEPKTTILPPHLSPSVKTTQQTIPKTTITIPYIIISSGTPTKATGILIPKKTSVPSPTRPTTTPNETPLPTVTPTPPGATPTPYLYATTDGTNGVVFSYTEPGTSVGSVIQIMNLGGSALTISELMFAITGGSNPYVLSGGGEGDCLTSSNLPYTLSAGVSRCISIHFNPTLTSTNTNSLLIRWDSSNIKTVPLSGNVTTPTPTRTPTITPTPT